MTIPSDLLINTALNIVGYVSAGALLILIYSMFKSSTKSGEKAPSINEVKSVAIMAEAKIDSSDHRIEFVDFQNLRRAAGELAGNDEQTAAPSSRFQRNRLEVIKQAREMLNAGKSVNDIRRRLPIAEAEMHMIGRNSKVGSMRGAVNDH